MTKAELVRILQKYVPAGSELYLCDMLIKHKIQLKLTKPRATKYGDYRAPHQGHGHRISVNVDLNPYAFLLTLVHEIAHLTNWELHRHRVEPHGQEWKAEFQKLLVPLFDLRIFPEDVLRALKGYIANPGASSCSDKKLTKTLHTYDSRKTDQPYLEQLPYGTIFKVETGRIFRKGEKLRSWYRCYETGTNHEYRVSGIAKVEVIEKVL